MNQRVRRDRAPRVGGDQILEVQDRGIVCLEPHVVQRRLVLLVGESLLQVVDPLLGPLRRGRARIPVEQLLVRRERGLAVGRIQLGAPPEIGVRRRRPGAAPPARAGRWACRPTPCGTRAPPRGCSPWRTAPRPATSALAGRAGRPAGTRAARGRDAWSHRSTCRAGRPSRPAPRACRSRPSSRSRTAATSAWDWLRRGLDPPQAARPPEAPGSNCVESSFSRAGAITRRRRHPQAASDGLRPPDPSNRTRRP